MILEVAFKPEERLMLGIQAEFNLLANDSYPDILEWSHYELWKKSGKKFNPQDWKAFRLDERVDTWYTQELLLVAKNRALKLLRNAGDNKSVGEAQALAQAMNYINRYETKASQQTKIIYMMVPLNEQEVHAPNVKLLQTIPDEIASAIVGKVGNK